MNTVGIESAPLGFQLSEKFIDGYPHITRMGIGTVDEHDPAISPEDIVQQNLLRILESSASFDPNRPDSSPDDFFYVVLHNLSCNRIRYFGRSMQGHTKTVDPKIALDMHEAQAPPHEDELPIDVKKRRRDLLRLFNCLTKKQLNVVLTAFIGGEDGEILSHAKTADRLGIEPNNAKVLTHRAIHRIRQTEEFKEFELMYRDEY